MRTPPRINSGDRVVLFDGMCKLCNGWSRFLIRRDRAQRFKLCSVQSPEGQAILAWFNMPTDTYHTMVLVEGNNAFVKSEAFLRIVPLLPRPWSWLRACRYLPKKFNDWAYDRIALNRYALFGQYDHCILPKPEDQHRFLNHE